MYFNERDFLEYLISNCKSNLRFIKAIKFNTKSITVKCDDKNLIFNEIFNERYLYNLIINYLILYIEFNGIDYPTDKDFLTYKFKKLNVR